MRARAWITALLLAPAGLAAQAAVPAAPAPVPAAAPAPGPPPLTPLPSEEDWRWFDDPARRRGLLNAVKYIPLDARPGWYLTLGGEARPFFERYNDEGWTASPGTGDGWLLQRYMLHAGVHLGPHLRVFGQLKSNLADGRVGGPRPPDEDRLDLNQLFVDVGLGRPIAGTAPLVLRLGRQELQFGSGRLVSVREGPNTRYGFDGARATVRAAGWRVDGWAARPVETDPGVFDDSWIDAEGFWGAHATHPLAILPGASVDLYYLGYDRDLARYWQGAGPETRHTVGARLWNRGQAFDFDVEAAGQGGEFANAAIRAWTVALSAGHSWQGAPLSPRVGVAGGVVSGDADRADPELGTFDPPAPRGAYFGHATPLGPGNIMGFTPQLTLHPAKGMSILFDSYLFWRQSTSDGIYTVTGSPLRGDSASDARFVAVQPQLEAQWQTSRHTRLSLNYARVYPGRFLEETGPAEDISYVGAFITFKF